MAGRADCQELYPRSVQIELAWLVGSNNDAIGPRFVQRGAHRGRHEDLFDVSMRVGGKRDGKEHFLVLPVDGDIYRGRGNVHETEKLPYFPSLIAECLFVTVPECRWYWLFDTFEEPIP